MSTIHHNKLVRDRIPEIIQASGAICQWETLSQEEYLIRLDEKLNEELEEYQEDKSLEELADLLEVLMAVAEARASFPEVEVIRRAKAEQRGGFARRVLLLTTEE